MRPLINRSTMAAGLFATLTAGSAMAAENIDVFAVSDATPYPGQAIDVTVNTDMTAPGDVWTSTLINLVESDGITPVAGSTLCVNQPDPDLVDPPLGTYQEVINYTIPASLADGDYFVRALGYRTTDNCTGNGFTGTLEDTFAVTVAAQADLGLTVVDLIDPTTAGSAPANPFNLLYQFTVTNNGPNEATNVVFVNTPPNLPTGVTFLGDTNYTATQGTYSGSTWSVGSLAVSSSATIELRFLVGPDAAVCDADTEACVSMGGGVDSDETDPVPGNDTAAEETSIVRSSDLQLSVVQDDPAASAPVVAGSGGSINLAYTFTATNAGPSDASNVAVAVTETLPAGVNYVLGSAGGDVTTSYDDAGNWTIGVLPAGATVTLNLGYKVEASAAVCTGCVGVEGTVSATEPDGDTNNNDASVTSDIDREYDLALAVTDTPDPVLAGSGAGNLTHQFTLSRSGPSDASGVSIAIVPSLPGGVAVYNWSETVGSFDGSTWTIPDADVEAADNGTVGTLDLVLTVDYTADSCTDCISASATASYAANETDTNIPNHTNISDPTSIENAADLTTTFATSINFDNDATDSVIVTLSCNAGLPLSQEFEISEGSDVIFTMTDLPFLTPGITCEITATDADGYALTAVANAGESAASCLYVAEDLAGNFERDASNSCVFTAVPAPTAITVNTMFENIPNDEIASDVDTDFETVITCQGASETAGSSFGEVEETDTTGTFTADWYADPDGGADCTVVLYPDSDAVEGDSCTFSFAVGDAEAGCDVVGTIFFEGVPTLSQYGLAIMALLLLGMGFVGFRRFV